MLGESHLAAAADLLDDPVPLLGTLEDLPWTLLHGAPHADPPAEHVPLLPRAK